MNEKLVSKFFRELLDPRYFQILYLGSFLVFGILFLHWQSDSSYYLTVISIAVITQLVFAHAYRVKLSSIKSSLITALGLCLLLKTSVLWVGALAAFIAIASKFIIRKDNKHVFNPANIGIIGAILLTNEAWVSPGQWGSSTILLFIIGAAGLMMILKVGRLDTAFTFITVFGALQYLYVVTYLGWEPSVWVHKMSNGTLLLFAFFMITDPMTTPNHGKARVIWACIIALALFIASNYLYVQTAAIWILFVISPLTPLFDKLFVAKKYEWNIIPSSKTIQNINQ